MARFHAPKYRLDLLDWDWQAGRHRFTCRPSTATYARFGLMLTGVLFFLGLFYFGGGLIWRSGRDAARNAERKAEIERTRRESEESIKAIRDKLKSTLTAEKWAEFEENEKRIAAENQIRIEELQSQQNRLRQFRVIFQWILISPLFLAAIVLVLILAHLPFIKVELFRDPSGGVFITFPRLFWHSTQRIARANLAVVEIGVFARRSFRYSRRQTFWCVYVANPDANPASQIWIVVDEQPGLADFNSPTTRALDFRNELERALELVKRLPGSGGGGGAQSRPE